MPKSIWYCTTASNHEHSTEWEAENCSEISDALELAGEMLDYLAVESIKGHDPLTETALKNIDGLVDEIYELLAGLRRRA